MTITAPYRFTCYWLLWAERVNEIQRKNNILLYFRLDFSAIYKFTEIFMKRIVLIVN